MIRSYQTGIVGGKVAASGVMDWSFNDSYDNNTNQNLKDSDPKPGTVTSPIISNIDLVDTELHSEEKGSTVLMPKKSIKTMTSVYPKYFETALDGKSRRCKICGQSYSIATATGNLGGHLSNRHPGYDKIGDFANSPTPKLVTVAKKPPTHVKLPSMELDQLNWLLIKWLISASLSHDYFGRKVADKCI